MYVRTFKEYFSQRSPQVIKLKLAMKGMRFDKIITIQEKSQVTLVKYSIEGFQLLPAMVESSCKRPTSKGTAWNRG
jgi:hypothetical protein